MHYSNQHDILVLVLKKRITAREHKRLFIKKVDSVLIEWYISKVVSETTKKEFDKSCWQPSDGNAMI